MNDARNSPGPSDSGTGISRVLFEAVLVAGFGTALALVANTISPRGLALGGNYFPQGTNGLIASPLSAPPPSSGETNPASAAQILAAQIKERGLQLIDQAEAARLFHDPRFRQQLIVFVDARDEEHYEEGHIPGAYELDPYRPAKHLATVLPACQAAEKVVIYCNGGECEDSQFAALLLRDAGVPNQKLFVFGGGISEWTADKLPIETGVRDSGTWQHTPE